MKAGDGTFFFLPPCFWLELQLSSITAFIKSRAVKTAAQPVTQIPDPAQLSMREQEWGPVFISRLD